MDLDNAVHTLRLLNGDETLHSIKCVRHQSTGNGRFPTIHHVAYTAIDRAGNARHGMYTTLVGLTVGCGA